MRPCVSCDSYIICGFYCKLYTQCVLCDWFMVLISCCAKIISKTKTVLRKMENQIVILKEFMASCNNALMNLNKYYIMCC